MDTLNKTNLTKDQVLNRMELAIEGSGFGVWQCDLQTGLLSWDKKMHEVYGYGDQPFSGDVTEWKQLIYPDDRAFVDEKFNALLTGQRIELFEFRIVVPHTQEIRYIEANGILQKDDFGRPVALLGMNRDISAIKKLSMELESEKAARAKESKLATLGEMAASLAHEINNPITIILGHKQLLEKILSRQNTNPVEIDRSLRIIEKTVVRISQIVKGLLSFSGKEATQELENKDLFEIIDDAIFYSTEKLNKNKVQLTLFKNNNKITVRSRPCQLSQVLVNLISNSTDAVERLPEKWIEIKIKDLTANQVVIAFTDSGCGIQSEIQKKIGTPFFSTKTAGKGFGLGLSISKKIVCDLGGSLELDETSTRTQFLLTLPIATQEQSMIALKCI